MSSATEIIEVAELDFAFERRTWEFAEVEAGRIAAFWAKAAAEKPAMYNGRVLVLTRRALERRPAGDLRMTGAFLETDYAAFAAWKTFGFPGRGVENAFSMAALRSADGAFLMGEMAPHNFSGGQIYFPAGTPDPSDVFDGRVDLDASARRELLEETGVDPSETCVVPGWAVVIAPHRVCCLKRMVLRAPAEEAKARIDAFLKADPEAEFSRMHIVRTPADIDRDRTPFFVAAYLDAELASA